MQREEGGREKKKRREMAVNRLFFPTSQSLRQGGGDCPFVCRRGGGKSRCYRKKGKGGGKEKGAFLK